MNEIKITEQYAQKEREKEEKVKRMGKEYQTIYKGKTKY